MTFQNHPFNFLDQNRVFYCESFPLALIKDTRQMEIPNSVLNLLIQDIKCKGIENPIILDLIDGNFLVLLGSKRFSAAKHLGLSSIRAIINVSNDENVNPMPIEGIISQSKQLSNSTEVIEIFGGIDKVDLNHLGIDQRGKLTCVGTNHLQWITCEEGANPRYWNKPTQYDCQQNL